MGGYSKKALVMTTLFFLFLTGSVVAQEEDADLSDFFKREKELSARISRLKQEQDFLLFQKEFYVSDSKYLILDISAGKGRLKYKNRLLKEFNFTVSSAREARTVPGGDVMLTKKLGSDHNRITLIFGNSIIMKTRDSVIGPGKRGKALRLYLKRRDLISLFYALEIGSRAYITPRI